MKSFFKFKRLNILFPQHELSGYFFSSRSEYRALLNIQYAGLIIDLRLDVKVNINEFFLPFLSYFRKKYVKTQ